MQSVSSQALHCLLRERKAHLIKNMKFTMFLAIVLLMCFALIQGMPQLTDNKEFSFVNHLQADGMKMEEHGSIAETHHLTKRESPVSRVNNEVDNSIRNKRDVQNKKSNQNCCNTNNGGNGDGVSNCVCNTYPRNNMNNNNNNMGATIYNNIYYICNCGTNPNPNNVMSCCTPSNNRNCNCCSACQCGCNNGTNVCICSGGGGTGNRCCSTSQSNSRGNVCYTVDKTCCNTQNTKHPPFNGAGFASHHGPVFIYNNYYYYCMCTPNNNIRNPSTCSTTCTCGCQPYTAQPFITPMTVTRPITDRHKEREFSSLDSTREPQGESEVDLTVYPQIFTNSYARTKPGVRFSPYDNINLGTNDATKTDSMRSNSSVYTYTFCKVHTYAPRQSEQTQTPTTSPPRTNDYSRNNHNRARHRRHGFSGVDLSELFRRFKK